MKMSEFVEYNTVGKRTGKIAVRFKRIANFGRKRVQNLDVVILSWFCVRLMRENLIYLNNFGQFLMFSARSNENSGFYSRKRLM